jgi:uncharacterized protein YajQ (UPF0234 family)
MATTSSFDIVSEVNLQEVDNAVHQARKEVGQRYDFKGTFAAIDLNQKEKLLTITADDNFKVRSVLDILQGKLVKRGVPLKALAYAPIEAAAGGKARQVITLRVGIEKDNARLLVKRIKETGLRVQAQVMDDQVRVTGKDKDDLQSVIAALKAADLEFAIQFTNYR